MGTYLVTGASGGIGFSIARYLAYAGHDVLATSRKEFNTLPKEFTSYFTADLRSASDRMFLAEWVKANFDGIDGIINNAGFLQIKSFEQVTLEDLSDTFEVNFVAPWDLTLQLMPVIKKHVINISSVSGLHGDPDSPHYGAAKAALIHWTKSLALQYPNLRVNSICPGFIETNLVPGDVPQFLLDTIPLGKIAHPNEIARVVGMLIESDYITGSNFVVDGGIMAK